MTIVKVASLGRSPLRKVSAMLILWYCFFSLSISWAQNATTASLSGEVTDASGAVVPGVQIRLLNELTGEERLVSSLGDGKYTVPLLSPGSYVVTADKAGYKQAVLSGVRLNVTERVRLDIRLQVGARTETVNVLETEKPLQTESAVLGGVVTGPTINALPLASRNYTQILGLSAGVSAEVNNAGDLGRGNTGMSGGPTGYSAHGGATYDNNFQLNGVQVNDLFGGGFSSGGVPVPNPESIAEFKVQTSQYDASYGRNGGANVDVVTKSGTNNFHGSLFEFIRNDVLNANYYFFNAAKAPRPTLRQNQFGGAIGGPIKKNKLFFFGSYQATRQANGVDLNCAATFREPPLTADRSAAALGALFAGQSGQFGGVSVNADGSNINPAALSLLQFKLPNGQYLIPSPQTIDSTQPLASQGAVALSIACPFNADQFVTDFDYLQNDKSKFAVRFFFDNSNKIETLSEAQFSGSNVPGFPQTTKNDFRDFSLTHDYLFSTHLVNQATFGYHRNLIITGQTNPFTFSGIGVAAPTAVDNQNPNIVIGSSLDLGGSGFGLTLPQDIFSLQDSLTWVHGRHTFQFGGGFEHAREQLKFQFVGALLFLSWPDFLLGQNSTSNGTPFSNVFASIDLLGDAGRDWRFWTRNAYAQDNIHVGSRLNVTLGLRYERLGAFGDAGGRNSSFDTRLSNPNPPASGTLAGYLASSNFPGTLPPGVTSSGNHLGIYGDGLDTFAPRLGFAWQLPHASNTVLRGGYGIYYSQATSQPLELLATAPPFAQFRVLAATSNANATFQNPFPTNAPALPSFPVYSPTTDLTPFNLDPRIRPSVTQQYSLNLQNQFKSWTLEVGYAGARGTKEFVQLSANQANLATPANPIRGVTTNTLANISQRVPVEGFDAANFINIESAGASWYNGLLIGLKKQLTKGLQVQASYTWARALTDDVGGSSSFNGGNIPGNQDALRLAYGPDSFVRPHRLVVNYLYEFPNFRRNALSRTVLSGWSVSGVTLIQSGQPLTIFGSNANNVFGITSDRAELSGACHGGQYLTSGPVESRLNNYFNTACWTQSYPVIGSDGVATGFGNSPVGFLSGPGQLNFDIAVLKVIPIGERVRTEFRAEFFNAFNTVNFANPNTNFSNLGFGFGQITSTVGNPRILQFALKIVF